MPGSADIYSTAKWKGGAALATIRSQMVLNDGMSAVLKKITAALDATLNAFEQIQRASGQAVDASQLEQVRSLLVGANAEIQDMADGYRRAAEQEENINRGLQNGSAAAGNLLGKVRGIVTTLGAAAGLKQLVSLSDQMAGTRARLGLIVDDGGSVKDLEAKIMASAQRSRAAYFDTAKAIASMGANAGAAFKGNDELIAFVEQINKQFVIGGANTQAQAAAMLQLTQAMGAGALRGEELNSILENAPGIARAIESYMGAAEGSIKSYAEQGLITAEVVKNAMFAAADETNAKFESMPMTWSQVWTKMQNRAISILDPLLTKINQLINDPRFQTAMDGLVDALGAVATIGGEVLGILAGAGAAIAENWEWLSPIILGVAGALGVYYGAQLAANAISLVTKGIHIAMAAAQMIRLATTGSLTAATAAETAAQYGLNAALYACPIVWIIMLIVLLIAAVYGAVAAINHFAGTSISATGVICGAFMTALAFIGNLFVTLVNLIIDVFVLIYNLIATVANFIGNVFNDPVGSVCRLFFDLADTVLEILQALASAIDTIFGSNLAGSVQGWRDSLSGWVDDTFGKGEEIMAKMNADDLHLKRFEYGAAYDLGYNFGQGIDDKVSSMFDSDLGGLGAGTGLGSGYPLDDISDYAGQTADNTGQIADELSISNEQLEYLRDIAERDAINRFTTAEVKIDMTGMTNKIDGSTDLDGVIRELTEGFTEALQTAAEGVHT